jgi:hypothetical protein
MTESEFEKRVKDVMRRDGLPEQEARIKVSVEAGEGGDVDDPAARVDPNAELERLGDNWSPKPTK